MKTKKPLDIHGLIAKYEKRIKGTINPDGLKTWEEDGFEDGKPDEFETIEDALFAEGEFDEGDQVEMRVCGEIVSDLKELQKSMEK